MSADRNTLGSLLQARRSQQGYSRARVAEAVGSSPGTIEGWEVGRVAKPPLSDVLRLARFLSISLAEIEQAALADDDETSREHGSTRSDSGAARRIPGTAPLLEEAIRVLGWSEEEAADFLQTTPAQIGAWRRRSAALPIVDVLALTSIVGARLSSELRGLAAGPSGDLA